MLYTEAIVSAFPVGIKISEPLGGYALWIELPNYINAFELFKQALEQGVSIAPGQIFSTDARFSHFIRISFGAALNDKIAESIRLLGQLIHRYERC